MTELLFALNWMGVTAVLARGLLRPAGYAEFPFLAAAAYATWYLPQASALLTDQSLPSGSLATVLLLSLLAFGAIVAGWSAAVYARRPLRRVELSSQRLVASAVVITLFSAAIQILIELQPAEARAAPQWTGTLTILAFLSRVGIVSLALSVLLVLERASMIRLGLLAGNLLLYAPEVLMYFRRADTLELALVFGLGLLFVRKAHIPRTAILCALLAGYFYVHGVGQLRALGQGYQVNAAGEIEARIPTLAEVAAIDWFAPTNFASSAQPFEVRNAAYYAAAVETDGDFGLGMRLWDSLVFAYVPGQLIGFEVKQNLMSGVSLSDLALMEAGYETHTGTTSTGFVLAFADFWHFGCIAFFATALCLGRFYAAARDGRIDGQLLYMGTLVFGLHAVSHSSYYLLIFAPPVVATAMLACAFAKPPLVRARLAMRRGPAFQPQT